MGYLNFFRISVFVYVGASAPAWGQSLNLTRSVSNESLLKKFLKATSDSPKPGSSTAAAVALPPKNVGGKVLAPERAPPPLQIQTPSSQGGSAGQPGGPGGMSGLGGLGGLGGMNGFGRNGVQGNRPRGNRILTTVYTPRIVGVQVSPSPAPNGTWECFLEGERRPSGSQNYRYLSQSQQRQIELFEDEGGWDPMISKKIRPGERFASVGMQKKYGGEAQSAPIAQAECYRMLGYLIPKPAAGR